MENKTKCAAGIHERAIRVFVPLNNNLVPLALIGLLVGMVIISGCIGNPQPEKPVGNLPEGMSIDVELPSRVEQNQGFNITVIIKNTADKAHKLLSIDIYDSYSEGIIIESSNPHYKKSYPQAVLNAVTYDYYIDIPAGGEVKVTFTAVAVKKGDFKGALDVVIDDWKGGEMHPLRTVVSD
ncbi:MAG: hypothetical protein A7316_01340 [Candidatus Altiarchaeales archaeon WOR_SM1_86-2]|nr:MAG: hypothetical protein A7315_05050 [Candidatus Altiarchaeales archaeon WOR_SM1_79]ODS37964.1 MAG: hypothetical protein A7316_01340 [Candidatus Altiarchaeales archaeon WOR_SM1_86-2]